LEIGLGNGLQVIVYDVASVVLEYLSEASAASVSLDQEMQARKRAEEKAELEEINRCKQEEHRRFEKRQQVVIPSSLPTRGSLPRRGTKKLTEWLLLYLGNSRGI
jgi:hypothetical protein